MENPFETLQREIINLRQDIALLHRKLDDPPANVPGEGKELLTAEEVCTRLKISRVTLWSWSKKGITKPITIGGNLKRYKAADIAALEK